MYFWVPQRKTVYRVGSGFPSLTKDPAGSFAKGLRASEVGHDFEMYIDFSDLRAYLQGQGINLDDVKTVRVKG